MKYLVLFCLIFFAQPVNAEPKSKEDLAESVVAGELTLNEYIDLRGKKVGEGHICNQDTGQPEYFEQLFSQHPWIHTIGEIGFNAGHSSDLFLRRVPDSIVYSFDIMTHGYAKVGKEYMDLRYPNRHRLIKGNSLESVPAFSKKNPSLTFDLIFIDGGHKSPVPYLDIVNMKAFARPDTIVILDDIQMKDVAKAWKECVEQKIITEGTVHKSNRRNWVEFYYILD